MGIKDFFSKPERSDFEEFFFGESTFVDTPNKPSNKKADDNKNKIQLEKNESKAPAEKAPTEANDKPVSPKATGNYVPKEKLFNLEDPDIGYPLESLYGYDPIYPKASYRVPNESTNLPKKPFVFKKPKPPINIITIVVENTAEVTEYKSEVTNLIKQRLVEGNKEALFLFIQIGTDQKQFELVDYLDISSNNLLAEMLTADEDDSDIVDVSFAVESINNFFAPIITSRELKFKGTEYKPLDISIVFIGTGHSNIPTFEENQIFSVSLKKLLATPCVKTLKYFCIKDKDCIRAASLGFPVIGHIESNFYK